MYYPLCPVIYYNFLVVTLEKSSVTPITPENSQLSATISQGKHVALISDSVCVCACKLQYCMGMKPSVELI